MRNHLTHSVLNKGHFVLQEVSLTTFFKDPRESVTDFMEL